MPLVLYSAVSRLAYSINQRFYKGVHFVWCAPVTDHDRFTSSNPPSSEPLDLYRRYDRESRGSDKRGDLITANRSGIIRGAGSRNAQGVINKSEQARIEQMALNAQFSDFTPLLLVIPFAEVRAIVKEVDGSTTAGAVSQEFIIEDLPRDMFDVIRWDDR